MVVPADRKDSLKVEPDVTPMSGNGAETKVGKDSIVQVESMQVKEQPARKTSPPHSPPQPPAPMDLDVAEANSKKEPDRDPPSSTSPTRPQRNGTYNGRSLDTLFSPEPEPSTSRLPSGAPSPSSSRLQPDHDSEAESSHSGRSKQSGSSSPPSRKSRARTNGDGEHQLTQVATTLPPKRKKKAARAAGHEPQLITHLPLAEEEALATFVRLDENTYATRTIGRSKGHEWGLICECNYRPGVDDIARACTEEGGCINRLTQVECMSEDCRCGEDCQNQRFQRKQYAPIEIVKTEKKGFGLRAAESFPAESFVHEYIGEVVHEEDFQKRMRRYHDERIPHFYFMMLQRDEYLDATKKGGTARFINHSCNPNCYVAKWHVGKHFRMGIFSQRDIVKGEELTFNYNVDRYGNDAQPCYCGEPNCVGTLGGKTQTDIGGMSNLYIEALGIVDEVESLNARGSKKQKSRVLDEDFTPTLHPLEEDEVPTVATAIRQAASNRSILTKLLERIDITDDVAVHKRFVRLHGFVLMSGVLTEWKDDRDVILACMRILAKWPLIARNKVVDTGIDGLVEGLRGSEDSEVASLASELYEAWQQLSLEFRIARKEGGDETGGEQGGAEGETKDIEDRFRSRRRREDDDEDSAYTIQERMDYALDHAHAPSDVSARLWAGRKSVPLPLGNYHGVPTGPAATRGRGGGRGGYRAHPRAFHHSFIATPATPQTPDDGATTAAYFNNSANETPTRVAQAPNAPQLSIEEIIRRANETQAAERERERIAAEAAAATASPESSRRSKHGRDRSDRDRASSSSSLKKRKGSNGQCSSDRDRHRYPTAGSSTDKKFRASLGLPGSAAPSSSVSPATPVASSKSTSPGHSALDASAGISVDKGKSRKIDRSNGSTFSSMPAGPTSHIHPDSLRSTEKKLHVLVGDVVVRAMSKQKDRMPFLDRDGFKRHARDVTDSVAKKEMKNPKFWAGLGAASTGASLPGSTRIAKERIQEMTLSGDKREKIKAFVKDYVDKLVARKGGGAGSALAATSTGAGASPGVSEAGTANEGGNAP